MKSLPRMAREMWLSGLTRKNFTTSEGTREWILRCDWVFAEDLKKNKIKFIPSIFDEYAQSSLYDAVSLAIAAFESVASFSNDKKKLGDKQCAWRSISLYYAAYFAANSIMRLAGYACTNISAVECASINEFARLMGCGGEVDSRRLGNGIYYVRPGASSSAPISMDILKGSGGVHIQFWIGFSRFLADLRTSIKKSGAVKFEKDAALEEADQLSAALSFGSSVNGAWLSEIRNSVNYRFSYGAWYPYDGSQVTLSEISAIMNSAVAGNRVSIPQVSVKMPEIIRAAHLSAVLVSWLRDSMNVISESSSGRKKKLIDEGALAMLLR
ncbi:TPA: hypothetical protein ACKP8M_001652 [Stenotrophomonas maltophilia]|nr:hypothetical protein [Stenotrophomonas maltophilia]